MITDLNSAYNSRLNLIQEIKLAKPVSELFPGQVLQALVVKPLGDGEVLLQINGQNINAKTAHHFSAHELLQVQVMSNAEETVLQVLPSTKSNPLIQAALAQLLPRQAPATQFLALLNALRETNISPPLQAFSVKFLSQIPSLQTLAVQMPLALLNSGLFLESYLSQWKKEQGTQFTAKDMKAQCLRLASVFPAPEGKNNASVSSANNHSIPLKGAIPQPLSLDSLPDLQSMDLKAIQQLLGELTDQVISRITAQQLHHVQSQEQGQFQLMLDLPIRTPQGYEVIPLLIEHQTAKPMEAESWSISFAVNLSHYGGIQAQLQLRGKQLDLHFHVDQTATAALLLGRKEEIQDIMQHLGIELGQFSLQQGIKNNDLEKSFNLVDIKI